MKYFKFNRENRSNEMPTESLQQLMMLEFVRLQKNELKWRVVRNMMFLSIFTLALLASDTLSTLISDLGIGEKNHYVSMVKIDGLISSTTPASFELVNKGFKKAFEDSNAKGVLVVINSPGGTPVQSGNIRSALLKYRNKYPDKKVVVVGQDTMASGAYMIATGSDKIYVSASTLTGSIGVKMEGFGYSDIMQKVGIERRLVVAGKNKAIGDPYSQLSTQEKSKLELIMKELHKEFIEMVKESRGDRLIGSDDKLFNGDIWTGRSALAIGLVDGIKDINAVLEEDFNVSKTRDYTQSPGMLFGMGHAVSSSIQGVVASTLATKIQLKY